MTMDSNDPLNEQAHPRNAGTDRRKLKLFNGRDWDSRGGHLYIAAFSQTDCADLCNQAYRKIRGYENRLDIAPTSLNEIRTYFSKGCWGSPMDGITPERGVWWTPKKFGSESEPPKRVI